MKSSWTFPHQPSRPPRQEPDSGSSSRPFSWQKSRMWKEQRAEPILSSGCTQGEAPASSARKWGC